MAKSQRLAEFKMQYVGCQKTCKCGCPNPPYGYSSPWIIVKSSKSQRIVELGMLDATHKKSCKCGCPICLHEYSSTWMMENYLSPKDL